MTARKSSQDRKNEILAATLDLAFQVGPTHVTTGMIATRFGLTQPAIYKHFPKKEDIWRGVTDKLCARIHANANIAPLSDNAPIAHVRQLILGHLQLVSEVPALPEIMVTRDATGNLTETRRRIQEAMGEYRAALERSLQQARLAGQLKSELSVDDSVSLLFGIIQSLVLRLLVSRSTFPLMQDGERLLDMQLALFRNEGHLS